MCVVPVVQVVDKGARAAGNGDGGRKVEVTLSQGAATSSCSAGPVKRAKGKGVTNDWKGISTVQQQYGRWIWRWIWNIAESTMQRKE